MIVGRPDSKRRIRLATPATCPFAHRRQPKMSSRPIAGRRAIVVAIVATVVAGCGAESERPIQGYIEGEYVRVAAPFAGRLQQLSVQRGNDVTAGAPLFALESENEVAARRQAEQQLQAAMARVANLKTGKRPPEVAAVSEQLRAAGAARDLSAENLSRQQKLLAGGFIAGAALDAARTQLQRDQAQVAQMQASVASARLPARGDEIRAAEADARAAREALVQSDWRVSQRAITSPVSGRVNDTYFVVGDWVAAGSPVASLLPAANVKIRFFVPEPLLGRLRPGQVLDFTCDACGAPMKATISFISDRFEYTPPVLYSKQNRARLVVLVEARLAPEVAARLNPGQPVDVSLPR